MASELLIDKSLKKIEYTFRWTGMNLESSKKTPRQNLKYKFYYFFNFVWLNTDVAGAVAWFINGAMQGVPFTILTYVAPCITMCFLANAKTISIFVYQDHINRLISILRNLEIAHRNAPQVVEKDRIVRKEADFLFLVLKLMNFFNWSLVIAFPLMPLGLMAIEYYSTKKIVFQLPLHILYPFDGYNIKYWPWVYLKQIWETFIVVIEMNGVDYLFYVCISFLCIQFKLLKHDLATLLVDDRALRKHDMPVFRTKLIHLVKWHQELINAVRLLEAIYTRSTLFNFVTSSMLICLSGFNVMTIDDKPFIVSFLSFLFASLLQIFTLCYFGDMLMISSSEVGDGVYDSKWYMNKAANAKELKIIHLRSYTPCKITAYGFADVNLKAFTKILSTSWSYFALLRTIYSSPRT